MEEGANMKKKWLLHKTIFVTIFTALPTNAMNVMDCYKIRNAYMEPEQGKLKAIVGSLSEPALDKMRAYLQQYLSECSQDYAYYGRNKIQSIVDLSKDVHAKAATASQTQTVQNPVTKPTQQPADSFNPVTAMSDAVDHSRFYRDCMKYGSPAKDSKSEQAAATLMKMGNKANNDSARWEKKCEITSQGLAWKVKLSSLGMRNDGKLDVSESVEESDRECMENDDCSPTTVAYYGSTGSQPMEPRIEKAWKAALAATTAKHFAGANKAQCESGVASACQRLVNESKITDQKLLGRACSLNVSEACSQLKKIQSDQQEKELHAKAESDARADRQRKKDSKECQIATLKGDYCKNLNAAHMLQLQIDREKAVGQETGYLNAAKLNELTSSRMTIEGRAKTDADKITQSEGRAPASADCKIQNQNEFVSSISSSIEDNRRKACGE